MKRNKVLSFLCATVSLFLALCSFASCVDRPSPEVVTEWEGKENFEPSDNANPELKARYEKCANRCSSAFDGAVPESGEGFEIAGADGKYVKADFKICGDKIIVSSESVEKPLYVRYLWTNYGPVTVFGSNGLPLAPFRTDVNK